MNHVYDPFERDPPYRTTRPEEPKALPLCRHCGQAHDAPTPNCPHDPKEPDYERY